MCVDGSFPAAAGVVCKGMKFDSDRIRNTTHLVTHGNCHDGTMSAFLVRQLLPDVKVTFIDHGSAEHRALKPEPGTVFCDIIPHESTIDSFVLSDCLILDHHKGAKAHLARFPEERVMFADEKDDPGVSGAVLAHRVFIDPFTEDFDDAQSYYLMGEFARLAGIYDTWVKKDPSFADAEKQAESLTFLGSEAVLQRTPKQLDDDIRKLGPMLVQKQVDSARDLGEKGVVYTVGGSSVLVVPTTSKVNKVQELNNTHDMVVGVSVGKDYQGNPQYRFSMRVHAHRDIDAAAICKVYGGGGHTKAAGMGLTVLPESKWMQFKRLLGLTQKLNVNQHPYDIVRDILTKEFAK